MSLSAHIETLEQKHETLDQMIQAESTRPLPDFMHISHLKKQKLAIKEELFQLLEQSLMRQSAS